MRQNGGAAACIDCLGGRLREAGFAPSGPIAVDADPALLALFDSVGDDDIPLHAAVLRLADDQVVLHHLLALPGCPQCGAAQSSISGSPARARVDAAHLLDPLLGIGSWLQLTTPEESRPEDETSLCHALAGQVHTPDNRHSISARGQGFSAQATRLGHLGETVERYAAFRPTAERLVHARAAELPGPSLLGKALFGLDAEQRAAVGYGALDGRRRIAWIEGRRICDDQPCWVPAAAIFLSREWNLDEARFCASVSHGMAAHCTAEKATTHALHEIHERACLTNAWHRQDFGVRLDVSSMGAGLRGLVQRIEAAGLQLMLSALQLTPAKPVVLAMIHGDHPPWFIFGAGANDTVQQAAESAVLEACSGWQALVRRPEPVLRGWRLLQSEDARGHHRYYASAERAQTIVNAVIRGSHSAGPVDPEARCHIGLKQLARKISPDAVVVDLTPPDCAAAGFSVQRLVAPGLPIYAFGRVGTPRVFQRSHGLPDPPMPHPFR